MIEPAAISAPNTVIPIEVAPGVYLHEEHDAGVQDAKQGISGDLFGQTERIELCRYCLNPLTGKQKFFDSAECRSAWHHLYEDALAEKVRRDRVPDAIDFVEANPDILIKIPEWIKSDMNAGIRARWKYYWELYWRWRWSIGKPVSLNDHHEKTTKKLIWNRHPECRDILRMKKGM